MSRLCYALLSCLPQGSGVKDVGEGLVFIDKAGRELALTISGKLHADEADLEVRQHIEDLISSSLSPEHRQTALSICIASP